MTLGICDDCGKEIQLDEPTVELNFPEPRFVHYACNLEAIKKSVVRDRLHSIDFRAGLTYGEWLTDITKRWRLK